jgi:CDP-paratose 2-epimerase
MKKYEPQGIGAVNRHAGKTQENLSHQKSGFRPVLITGGAGFIGINLAHRLLSERRRVRVFDNLARAGVEANLRWLQATHGDLLQVEIADVRDFSAIKRAVKDASQIFHLAAQVAVTTSLVNPIEDFEINARGTLNLLEAVRALNEPPPIIFTSTNKVYGHLEDVALKRENDRYVPEDAALRQNGISERRPIKFHSPHGCSKGAADQYVLDYARTFRFPAIVFRMSCIYGCHQFGTEDQGWVAHFLIRAIEDKPINIYGDGMQVRDVLFADDLIDALQLAQKYMPRLAGRAFNIGGGAKNAISLRELIALIGELRRLPDGETYPVRYAAHRDLPAPPYGRTKLYKTFGELRETYRTPVCDADLCAAPDFPDNGERADTRAVDALRCLARLTLRRQ